MKNNLLVFASTPSRIPIFPTNTLTICRIEANQLELFVFLTLCGSKSNNYSTLMQCRFIYSNNTNNNSSNNSKMAEVRFSIFKICFENGWILKFNIQYLLWYSLLGRILQPRTTFFCFAYYSTWVFEVCALPRPKSRSRTPLCRNSAYWFDKTVFRNYWLVGL